MSPAPTNVVSRTALLELVKARLTSRLAGVPQYVGEAGDVPAINGDPARRVVGYYVLYPFGGNPAAERAIDDHVDVDVQWGLQITCAGGFVNDALSIAQRVESALFGWRLGTPMASGKLRPPDGYDPGPVQVDRDTSPHRFWVPLQYGTTISAT